MTCINRYKPCRVQYWTGHNLCPWLVDTAVRGGLSRLWYRSWNTECLRNLSWLFLPPGMRKVQRSVQPQSPLGLYSPKGTSHPAMETAQETTTLGIWNKQRISTFLWMGAVFCLYGQYIKITQWFLLSPSIHGNPIIHWLGWKNRIINSSMKRSLAS